MSNIVNNMTVGQIQEILSHFNIHGNLTSYKTINKGYINKTFSVNTLSERGHEHHYILQRVNDYVFKDVEGLMKNIELVSEYLKEDFVLPGKRENKKSILTLIYTKEGASFYKNELGYWRVTRLFENVSSFDIPDSPDIFRSAGYSFGLFIKKLSHLDPGKLNITIPDFHNTPARYDQLMEAIKKDCCNRASEVQPEIEFFKKFSSELGLIADALKNGEIPYRICHNDCNLNNILFDKDTKKPVAVIDLDTVMPSSPLYDFGDSMRIGTNHAKDDETDLSKVYCDLTLYREYANGFLSACGDMLTDRELQLLPYAAIIITSEDALRFLADYINGDVYYSSISYPTQNLDRARNQIKLCLDMFSKLDEIKTILKEIYSELGLHPVLG